jgi:diketogulonate reductase-like aldo/keto reductase
VELQPFFPQDELLAFCKSKNIIVTAFCPLGNLGKGGADDFTPLNHATVKSIAEKHHKTAGQIVLRWGVQHGQVVLPKSVNPDRIRSNIQLFDFELDAEDMQQLAELGKKQHRFIKPVFGGHAPFP